MNNTSALFTICGVIVAISCNAATRSSASYSITTESLDAGGQQVTSAAYRVEGSIGEIGGRSSSPTGSVVVKNGFSGQLYEVTGFVIDAVPPRIDETTTRQIEAARTLDDGSRIALNPTLVTWTVQSGPLTISRSGAATAGAVYLDTGAQVRGVFEGKTSLLALTVRNTAADNYGSYAGDQIDDAWQVQYFGENNPAAGPQIDPDGDGQNNLFEFTAGVVPTSATSLFKLEIMPVPGQPTHRNLVFSPRVAGRTYTAQSRLSLTDAWEPLAPAAQSANGNEGTITDLRAIEPAKFYQIQITKP